jgi:3-oxoacyl-[acyl-carrier protein] reductase
MSTFAENGSMKFSEKAVLVTGGSRGIGKAIALAFAAEGARVCITYRKSEEEAEATLRELPGGPHMKIRADVADPQEVFRTIETTVDHFGRLDILVNNAGTFFDHRISEINFDDWQEAWRETLSVNLTGPANMCYFASRQMIRQGGGKIINISSRGAFRGEPNSPAYGASKAGLNSMSQSLAQALAPYNIYVGVIAPGFVETDMAAPMLNGPAGESIRNQSPLKRAGKPEEIAHAVLMFAADGAEFMTGCIIDVNGASHLRS